MIIFSIGILLSSYNNLNYSLDTSNPSYASYTIIDKHCDHSFRSPDFYKLTFEVNGKEFDVEVDVDDYNNYEIGNSFKLYHSNGFFNDPYYYAYK